MNIYVYWSLTLITDRGFSFPLKLTSFNTVGNCRYNSPTKFPELVICKRTNQYSREELIKMNKL